jgi:hypothetical protein
MLARHTWVSDHGVGRRSATDLEPFVLDDEKLLVVDTIGNAQNVDLFVRCLTGGRFNR